ncbi:MAG: glycosyltransferase, partial [Paraprevotella sp.]|nr:glycosyltransferase [Paraprevotella sp.]
YPEVSGLKLAHNVGHQQALWAGLEWASVHADAAVSIDADLQDDVRCIPEMVEAWLGGADVVYGIRRERDTDTFFKKNTAQAFYKLMSLLGCDIVYNHADFRLMSRRALQALVACPERNLFLRGMVKALGYPSACVYYDRKERLAGKSKYPLGKMIGFALDGITSFSVRPLRYISLLGLFFILISFVAIVYGVVVYIKGDTIPGWTSLLVSVWFIGGSILKALGIIGEYVGKIYKEVKRRPRYLIEQEVGLSEGRH